MEKRIIAWLTLLLCSCGLLLSGQSTKKGSSRSGSLSKNAPALYVPADTINVDMSLSRPPVYNTDGKKTRIGSSSIPEVFKQWMVNEISFSISFRPGKRILPLALENVKVELYIYAPGSSRDGVTFRWLCGVQDLQCVVVDPELRMRKYWASLFLPSSYVYLHIPLERGKYSLRMLEGVVIISDKDNNILGRKAFGYRGKLTVNRAQTLVEAASQLRGKKTKNQVMLFPREKTPWAWLDADRFEFPAVEQKHDFNAPSGNKAPVPPAGNGDKGNEE